MIIPVVAVVARGEVGQVRGEEGGVKKGDRGL